MILMSPDVGSRSVFLSHAMAIAKFFGSNNIRPEVVKPAPRKGYDDTDVVVVDDNDNRNLSNSFVEHHQTIDQIKADYPQSNINVKEPMRSGGLSSSTAAQLLLEFGKNCLPPPREQPAWQQFLIQFKQPFWILMLSAASLSVLSYAVEPHLGMLNLWLGLILYSVVILMCTASFFQERQAKKAVAGFKNLLPENSAVLRDGKEQQILTMNLVVGDLVIIKNGNKVPADARILHCSELKLETSSITGEAEAVDYTASPAEENVTVFEARNVAFNGSFCVDGEAIAIVIRTGAKTIIGRIASLTTEQELRKSSLEVEIRRFVMFITYLAMSMGTVLFIIGCVVTRFADVLNQVVTCYIVMIISNIPQGMPTTVVSQLTLIARRMASENVYLKRLDVIEAFGAATVIASDKTGTLTMNNMTVTDLWYDNEVISGLPPTKPHNARHIMDMFDRPLAQLLAIMAVCNKGRVVENVEKVGAKLAINIENKITGSASEVALLRYVEQLAPVAFVRDCYQTIFEIPFNSLRKWHLIITKSSAKLINFNINDDDDDDLVEYTLMMKGAPEVLIKKCTHIQLASGTELLDSQYLSSFQTVYDRFGNEGRRVIGFAMATFRAPANVTFTADSGNYPIDALTFIGIAAIMDPPRPDTAQAIAQCKSAGIKVFMVTGDHPSTAAAIARQIGLIGERTTGNSNEFESDRPRNRKKGAPVVECDWTTIHGERLPDLSDSDWDQLLRHKYIVFARTTPEQKLMIVEECQKRNEVIAMTGDGVNDAPALKRADIGVAMGITGSDVAKQAADIVLMDDNFSSIVKGIKQGRLMFDNLRKTIGYTLGHVSPEVWPLVLNICIGLPMALLPLQIMVIDLGSEVPPAVALAYEPPESDIMKQPPRPRSTHMVSKNLLGYSYFFSGMVLSIAAILAFLSVYVYHDIVLYDVLYTSIDYWQASSPNFTSNGHTFTAAMQVEIYAQSTAAYHITMVMSQVFHVWTCTTRRESLFTYGIRNYYLVGGVIIELAMIACFIFCPGLNTFLGAAPPPGFVWGFSVVVGLIYLIVNELRKYLIRNYPDSRIVHYTKW